MGLPRHVCAILGVLSLPACTTTQTSAPKFDLVTQLIATWAGQHGTLQLHQGGQFTLSGREVTSGTWAPAGAAHLEISQPTQQTCAYALDGDRLLVTGCLLAGEYFRVRH